MTTWKIDPSHSSANFSIKHMMIAKVHGGFDRMSGTLEFDPGQLAVAKVDVSLDAASINTRETQRDTHLKSPDFLDVEKYPTLRFVSTKIEATGSGEFTVTGDLSLHGVTKPVTLQVEGPSSEMKDPWGQSKIGVSATGKIKRKDFGLNWNAALEAGGFLVGDEVAITLDVQFIKQA